MSPRMLSQLLLFAFGIAAVPPAAPPPAVPPPGVPLPATPPGFPPQLANTPGVMTRECWERGITSLAGFAGILSDTSATSQSDRIVGIDYPGTDFAPFSISTNFACRMTAEFNVGVSGNYTFFSGSDDGSSISIDGQTVVDNDGLHFYVRSSLRPPALGPRRPGCSAGDPSPRPVRTCAAGRVCWDGLSAGRPAPLLRSALLPVWWRRLVGRVVACPRIGQEGGVSALSVHRVVASSVAADATVASTVATIPACASAAAPAELPTVAASATTSPSFAALACLAAASVALAITTAAAPSAVAAPTVAAATPDSPTPDASSAVAGAASGVASSLPRLGRGLAAERRAVGGRGRQPKVPFGSCAGERQSPRHGACELHLQPNWLPGIASGALHLAVGPIDPDRHGAAAALLHSGIRYLRGEHDRLRSCATGPSHRALGVRGAAAYEQLGALRHS